MTTDNDKQTLLDRNVERQAAEFCAPNGTCYELDDARRALRDRPSMEAELTALRDENLRFLERKRELMADNARLREEVAKCKEMVVRAARERDALGECEEEAWTHNANLEAERDALRKERDRLRVALREVGESKNGENTWSDDVGETGSEPCKECVKKSSIARSALEPKATAKLETKGGK